MKLLTKDIETKLFKHPYSSLDNIEHLEDCKIIVKYFNPYGLGTWLIVAGDKLDNGDWLLYGYCNLYEWEWGTVLYSEIANTTVNVFGQKLHLERDMYLKKGLTIKEYIANYK